LRDLERWRRFCACNFDQLLAAVRFNNSHPSTFPSSPVQDTTFTRRRYPLLSSWSLSMAAAPVLEVGQLADHVEQRHAERCIGSIIREGAAIAAVGNVFR
jgi:hypothetical protein